MSKKFEKLLDLVVNEEMDKANELFHEIVVEMSREIYENMIAEEADEEDESVDEASEEMEEEAVEEGSYDEMEEETTMEIGGDPSDDFIDDTQDDDAMGDDEDYGDMGDDEDDMDGEEIDGEGDSEERISDLEDALEELKAEFEALMAGEENEPEHSDMFGDDEDEADFGDEKNPEKEGYHMESRRMTREYREKVSDGHGAEKKGKAEEGDGKSGPVSSAKGRPTSDANAKNIAQSGKGVGEMTGDRPNAKSGGLAGTPKGEFTKVKGTLQNVNGAETGVKKLSKVGAGHGAEKSGSGETSVNKKPIVGG